MFKKQWLKDVGSQGYDKRILDRTFNDIFVHDYAYGPSSSYRKLRIERVLGALKPQVNDNILDVGCGTGPFTYFPAKEGATVTGIDYSYESLRKAQEVISGLDKVRGKSQFVCAEATKMPFKDFTFDKIVAADFVEHITFKQKQQFLKETYRLLKRQGYVVIHTPNKFSNILGVIYRKFLSLIKGQNFLKITIPFPMLHIGVSTTFELARIVKDYNFSVKFQYFSNLAIPLVNKFPKLNNILCTKVPILRDLLTPEILLILRKDNQ